MQIDVTWSQEFFGFTGTWMTTIGEDEYVRLLVSVQPKLWTLAAAILGDRSLAEDVVQDAAITGLRRLADFQEGTNFLGWISQIVRFTALNYRKSKKRRKQVSVDVHKELGDRRPDTPSPVTMQGQLAPDQHVFGDKVSLAIEQLDADRRACFLLRVVHSLDYDEISEIVGLPKGTAMSHVHRAKTTLRQALSGEIVEGRDTE